MPFHVSDGFPARVENRRQIDVERPLPMLVGRLEDVSAGDDAGVIDEHVQSSRGPDAVVDQLLAELAGPAPDSLLGSVELGLEPVQASLVGVARNDTIAVCDELPGDRLPDTSGRACYQRGFLLNVSLLTVSHNLEPFFEGKSRPHFRYPIFAKQVRPVWGCRAASLIWQTPYPSSTTVVARALAQFLSWAMMSESLVPSSSKRCDL